MVHGDLGDHVVYHVVEELSQDQELYLITQYMMEVFVALLLIQKVKAVILEVVVVVHILHMEVGLDGERVMQLVE